MLHPLPKKSVISRDMTMQYHTVVQGCTPFCNLICKSYDLFIKDLIIIFCQILILMLTLHAKKLSNFAQKITNSNGCSFFCLLRVFVPFIMHLFGFYCNDSQCFLIPLICNFCNSYLAIFHISRDYTFIFPSRSTFHHIK